MDDVPWRRVRHDGFRAMVLDSQFWTFGLCQQLAVSLIASGLVAVVSMGSAAWCSIREAWRMQGLWDP